MPSAKVTVCHKQRTMYYKISNFLLDIKNQLAYIVAENFVHSSPFRYLM